MNVKSLALAFCLTCAVTLVYGADAGTGAIVANAPAPEEATITKTVTPPEHETKHALTAGSVPQKGDTPAAKAYLDALDTLPRAALTNADFAVAGVHRGDSLTKVRQAFGSPIHYSQSDHFTKIQYDDLNQALRLTLRNDTADVLKENGEERKAVQVGVDSLFLMRGKDFPIGSAIYLRYPAEALVRQFGVPTNVLRDADADVYYFVYESPDKESSYVFAVANRRVERVALMPPRAPYIDTTAPAVAAATKWSERDFTLMGFGLDKPFEANKYNMWTNLIKRNTHDFWLYGSYGLEVNRRNMITKAFLLTNNAYTNRGATLGYYVSTILALYGRPDRLEIGPDTPDSVDAYYYDSPFQKGVSLVFVVKHNEHYVDDILLTSEPIQNLQDPMERYGLKE